MRRRASFPLCHLNDFRVIFWQKLANLYDVICAINLFSVKIDKKKLQSGDTPITNVSLESSQLKNFEEIQKNC